MNYWLFKCNPLAYCHKGAYAASVFTYYNTPQHFKKIKRGDKAIIWITTDTEHCFAVADIMGDPLPTPAPIPDSVFFPRLFRRKPNIALHMALTGYRVNIDITHAAAHERATMAEILRAGVSRFTAPPRGTVHQLHITDDDYKKIVTLL